MTIQSNIEQFLGKQVREFEPGKPITDVNEVVYRLRVTWEMQDKWEQLHPIPGQTPRMTPQRETGGLWQGVKRLFGGSAPEPPPTPPAQDVPSSEEGDTLFGQLLHEFASDPCSLEVTALVIGAWGNAYLDDDASMVVEALVEEADRLPNLKALFIGDITVEESEISWIKQADLHSLWTAYPNLEHLQVRGTEGLSLAPLNLPRLKTLIIESGGLPLEIIKQVYHGNLPALEQLELWLGSESYGGDSSVDDLRPILDASLFPNLRHLGLRNCEYADKLAEALADAPVLNRIRVLDLSMGNLSDEGGEALLNAPGIRHLERLDLHHHYLSDEVMAKLAALGIDVVLTEKQETEYWDGEANRYIAVSE